MRCLSALSFLTMFLVGTDTFLVAPLLPTLTRRFGNPATAAGWMVSAYAIGYCLVALVAGPLSDRFDRRYTLIVGMAGFATATAACGFAWSFPAMLALRFLTGACAAIAAPQIWAAIPQLVPPGRIVAAMAAPTAGLTVAQLAGVPIGSFLAAGTTSLPFLAVGAASLLLTVALVRWFPSVPSRGVRLPVRAQYSELLRTPRALPRFGGYFLFQLGNFAGLSFAASWFASGFGLDTTGIGAAMIVLGAGNTAGAIVGPRIVAALGQARSLVAVLCGYLLCYAVLPFSRGIVMATLVLAAVFFLGGVVFPVFMSLLQSLTTTARGTVSSLANVLMYAGSAIAGVLGGPLLARLPGFFGIAALVLVAVALSLAMWLRSGLPGD